MIGQSMIENQYNEMEYCYTCEKYKPIPSVIKAYIPTLMPMIGLQKPKLVTEILLDVVLTNDAACKPFVDKTVVVQNYISIPKGEGYQFPPSCAKGHRFTTMIPFKNFNNKYFTAHG